MSFAGEVSAELPQCCDATKASAADATESERN